MIKKLPFKTTKKDSKGNLHEKLYYLKVKTKRQKPGTQKKPNIIRTEEKIVKDLKKSLNANNFINAIKIPDSFKEEEAAKIKANRERRFAKYGHY